MLLLTTIIYYIFEKKLSRSIVRRHNSYKAFSFTTLKIFITYTHTQTHTHSYILTVLKYGNFNLALVI